MNCKIKKKIKSLNIVFKTFSSIKAAYSFGSCLRRNEIADSDMDFALLLSDNHDFKDRTFLAYELEKNMGFLFPVDVTILNYQEFTPTYFYALSFP